MLLIENSAMEVEFSDFDRKNTWNSVFQAIKNESNNYSHITVDAKKVENKNLNRYRDVNPFDHSRVRLERGEKDYINASLVKVPSAGRSYILTQGPLPATMGHFWLMIWEQKSTSILMLNRVIEKNTVKCHQYWPVGTENGGSNDLLLLDVGLKISFLHEKNECYYIVRKFCLTDIESQNSREIFQFHYTMWPDFGVPESPGLFLNFLFDVRKYGVLNSNVGPSVVHCSAGIGRSGTFCLVDSCLVLIEKNKDVNSVNIRQQLLEMRHYRMGLIQTPDQLRFSYVAIIEGAKRVLANSLNSLSSENIPENCRNTSSGNISLNLSDDLHTDVFSPPSLPPHLSCNSDDLCLVQTSCMSDSHNGRIRNSDSNLCMNETALNKNMNSNKNDLQLDNKPAKQVISFTSSSYSNPPSSTPDSFTELRKRVRVERETKTAILVKNIKKKQKETELWEKQRSFLKISLGLVLIIGLGYFVYKNCSKS